MCFNLCKFYWKEKDRHNSFEVEDSGENNEDYYVDQEIPGETIGKYKQETSKSNSRIERIEKK